MRQKIRTTVVGSYPKPSWLKYLSNVDEKIKEDAFKDAVRAVVKDQEIAGVEILWDGEVRREEMTSYFAERIGGFVIYGEVRVWGNTYYPKPAIVDELTYEKPLVVHEFEFLREITDREIKVPVTGAYTLVDWSFNEYYTSREEAIYALAKIINEELKKLVKAKASFIQLDEPALSTHSSADEIEIAKNAVEEMLRGINVYTAIHICYGNYERLFPHIMEFNVDQLDLEFANRGFSDLELLKEYSYDMDLGFGCIDVHTSRVESVEEVVNAIKLALEVVEPEKLYVDPDCGLKLLPRDVAFKKLRVMCEAAKMVRDSV
ncbi:MAG: methionine synthase [Archaeoglobus sp.]|nr:MAG: methionine synthase [Archaeoglobus sp.]